MTTGLSNTDMEDCPDSDQGWAVEDIKQCGLRRATVSFYAVDPTEKVRLKESLRKFSSRLPLDVTQSGDYLVE
jgi:hypothetical protein